VIQIQYSGEIFWPDNDIEKMFYMFDIPIKKTPRKIHLQGDKVTVCGQSFK